MRHISSNPTKASSTAHSICGEWDLSVCILSIPAVVNPDESGNDARENRAEEESRYEWQSADQLEGCSLEATTNG